MMPGIDGFKLCQFIKTNQQTRKCKVVTVTGYGNDENIARAMAYGAERVLFKPVNIETDLINNNVTEIATKNEISIRMFEDVFYYLYDFKPKQFINNVRVEKLIKMMRNHNHDHSKYCYKYAVELGFMHSSSLYKFVSNNFGMTYKNLCKTLLSDDQNPFAINKYKIIK